MTNPIRDDLKARAWLGVPVVGTLLILLFFALPTGATEPSVV